jgi:hypothetical protein
MKTVVQKAKTPNVVAAATKPSRAPAKPRNGAANRQRAGSLTGESSTPGNPVQRKVRTSLDITTSYRTDRLEQEADNAAERFLRGETGIARRLTRTQPSAMVTYESIGLPLPRKLLKDLELGFGADLSEVRIHRNRVASALSDQLGAWAFASGRDLFISKSAPAWDSKAGKRLIAHEVAHAIQQTGIATSGNRVAVRKTSGKRRRPQLAYKSALESTPAGNRPTFDDLIDIYGHTAKQNVLKDLNSLKKRRLEAVAQHDESSFWTSIEIGAKADEFEGKDARVRSFVFDGLKLNGKYGGAAYLLQKDINLSSTFYIKEVYEKLPPAFDFSWILKFWQGSTFFSDQSDKTKPRDFTPTRFLRSIQEFLLGATRDVPDLSPTTQFAKFADDEIKAKEDPKNYVGNELYLMTVWSIKEVDQIRQKKLSELAQKIAPELVRKGGTFAKWLSPNQRKQVAKELEKWAATLTEEAPDLNTTSDEVKFIYKWAGKTIVALAQEAAKFWTAVEVFQGSVVANKDIEGLGNPRELIRQFGEREEFQDFKRAFLKAAKKHFALKTPAKDDLSEQTIFPSPKEYEKSRDEFAGALRTELYTKFERRLLTELRKPEPPAGKKPTSKHQNLALALAYGVMANLVYQALDILNEYRREDDETYASNAVTSGRADVRMAHRQKLAMYLWSIGAELNWEAVMVFGNAVISSQQEGQKQSQLALLTDWHEDKVSISKLGEDFNRNWTVKGWEPISFGNIIMFYLSERFNAIRKKIEEMMAQPNAFDPKQETLVTRAIRASDQAATQKKAYPRRFSVDTFVPLVRPEDVESGNFANLIRSHPKTVALLAAEKIGDAKSVAPNRPAQGVFLWIIPSILPLIQILRGIDEFSAIIFKARSPGKLYTADDLVPIKQLEPVPWFDELHASLEKVDETDVLEARKKMATLMKFTFDTSQEALMDKMREASILERQMRVKEILRPGLEEYDRYDQFSPSKKMGGIIYEIPWNVLKTIGNIASAMAPVEEQDFHYAAMFLELAELMNDRLSVDPRTDVANDYYAAIQVALMKIDKSKKEILTVLPGRDEKWIDGQVKRLNSLLGVLEKKLVEGQQQFGIVGSTSGFVTGVDGGGVIQAKKTPPRDTFQIDGVIWAVLSVKKNFLFHPKYGELKSVLYVDDKEVAAEDKTKSLVLLTITRDGGPEQDVTAAAEDEELLAKVSYAVTMALIVRQLEELRGMMESFAELTLDALELIPGAGQAVMAARFAIAIMTFIASGEAQAYVDAITKDPLGEVKRILDLIGSLFSPDVLWHYLLLGNNQFDQLHSKPVTKKPPAAPESAFKKFMRLMSRVWNVGEGIFGSIGRMQSHLRWKVESVQMSVMRHPLLAGALRWISNHLEQIVQVTLMAIAIGEKLMAKPGKDQTAPDESELDLKGKFDKAVDEIPDRINEAAFQLGELQLPEEIISLGELVDIIVQVLLGKLGKKYRVVGAVILKLLEIAGKRQAVFNAVASLIPDVLNPNTYWKKEIVEPISPMLNDAKNQLIDSFYDHLLDFDFFKAKKDRLEAGRSAAHGATIAAKSGDLPEQEVQPSGANSRLRMPVGHLPTPGPSLAPSLLNSTQRRFGHDFSHVRMASGTSGRFANRFGADAVTSGSQIYLRPGLSPTFGVGQRVFHHELVHVLQQTGPRPLGGSYSKSPVSGTRSRGLLIDPVSERAADRISGSMSSRAKNPISVKGNRPGVQPALPYNIIRGLLDDVTSTTDIEVDEAKVDRTGTATGIKHLPDEQKSRLSKFEANLKDAINTMTSFESPFGDSEIPAAIKDHILNGGPADNPNFTAIKNAFEDIAEDSLRERKAKAGEVKEDQPQVVAHIDAQRFGVALGRYIFGRTGMLIKFEMAPADEKDESTEITCSKLSLIYVHLPPVRGNHRLWTKAVEGLVGKNKEETDLLADKEKLFRRMRLYLESKGPSPGIWKPKSYGLQQRVLSDLVEFVKAMAAGDADLTPAELPGKKEYLDPTGSPGPTGHIGLRIGTYKNSKNQQGKDRESHHTTQFLLLEYFAHKNDTQKTDDMKPFPLIAKKADLYPGLEATATNPTKFTGPTTMDIEGLVKGERGDAMPAILIARPTHRTGNLHVTTKADDLPDKIDSQAGVVNFIFHEKLGGASSDYVKAEKGGVADFEKFKLGETDDKVKMQIYVAMQGTYKWMRDFMRERLDNALPGIEMKYYNQLAEDGNKKDRLKPGEMALVGAAAKENNNVEMAKWGWVG